VRTAKLTIGDQTERGAQLLFRANGVSQMSNSHVANEALCFLVDPAGTRF
jgi:hypothetical protein